MSASSALALEAIDRIILGKSRQTRLALCCLLAGGHLLIEDLPGVGKTTLALALAKVLGLDFRRIQFTSDLLPADVLGVSIYDRASGRFHFEAGPVFTEVLLADEINRASPKTQSALLEAMEEGQVSIDGETRPLPRPFFVIATQNPRQQVGTYPLPESQLDRFLMRIALGYPSREAEQQLLEGGDARALLATQEAILDRDTVLQLQTACRSVRATPALAAYILALLQHSRELPGLRHGLSPRTGLALKRAAQAWALLEGRSAVFPEDVQAVFPAVVQHRLMPDPASEAPELHADALLAAVAIP